MYNISDNQVDYITNDIKKRGIELSDLQDNLLDHVCCIIENELTETQDFYEFYENTISRFYKKVLSEIEEETQKLLTFKNYYAMKRTMNITGAISTLLILAGAIFRFFHIPGYGLLLVTGMPLFSLVFMPLIIALKFKDDVLKKEKIIFSIGFGIGIIGFLGMLAKIMYWPIAAVLIKTSIVLFLIIFIPLFFFNGIKQAEKKFNTIIITLFMIVSIAVIFSLSLSGPSNMMLKNISLINSNANAIKNNLFIENEKMFSKNDTNKQFLKIHIISKKLFLNIDSIKYTLISKAEHINYIDAEKYSFIEILNIKQQGWAGAYMLEKLDIKYSDFNNKILYYNNELKGIIGKPIIIDEIISKHQNLALFIHQLTQIQLQIATNENSYLNYMSGKLSK